MNDPRCVRHIERIRDLGSEVHNLLDRDWPALDAVFQGCPFEIFHHDKVTAFILANVVNRANVGMVESRRRSGLALKAVPRLRILRKFIRQEFEGDSTS